MATEKVDPKVKALVTLKSDLAKDAAKFGAVKTEKDVAAIVASLSIGDSDATLNRQTAFIAYTLGTIAKGNAVPDFATHFAAIDKRMRGGDTGRKSLAKSSYDSMLGYFNAYAALGMSARNWGDDGAEVFPYLLNNISGVGPSWGTRKGVINAIAALPAAPSADDMAARIAEKRKLPTLASATERLYDAGDKIFSTPNLKDTLKGDPEKLKAYAIALKALENLKSVCAGDNVEGDDDDRKMLREAMREAA